MGTIDHDVADSVVALGHLALQFGRVDRITRHEDGVTPESDTDHTVMLGLIACAFAEAYLPNLDIGIVAQFALVHDVVEAYAGDTATLRVLSVDAQAAKRSREHAALQRIGVEFGKMFPWLSSRIAEYEERRVPEARFVKALDKLLPKITHILNDLVTIHEHGMSRGDLALRYALQAEELADYASDFPVLFDLRAELVRRVMAHFDATAVAS